ncbi:MAG: endonuclease III [Hyphomicrobium sp.]
MLTANIRRSTAKGKSGPTEPRSAVGAKPGSGLATKTKSDLAHSIFERFRADVPEPKGELEHVNAYTLLVAVVLSAQATDAGVNKATRRLFELARTPAEMLALGEERVRELIKTIGLYRNKARNVIALSERLVAGHGGEVPADRDALEALPGVGRKTANVVMNMAFGRPTMAVDTHVFRVSNRTGLSKGKTPLAVEADLIRVIPPEFGMHAHHWLILHGRYVCKARRPECWRCLIRDLCRFPDKASPVRTTPSRS